MSSSRGSLQIAIRVNKQSALRGVKDSVKSADQLLGEAAQNAIDSGTDRIDLYVAGKAFIIADEGKGMSSKSKHRTRDGEEYTDIEAFFNVGFSTKGQRTGPNEIQRGYMGQGTKMMMSKVKGLFILVTKKAGEDLFLMVVFQHCAQEFAGFSPSLTPPRELGAQDVKRAIMHELEYLSDDERFLNPAIVEVIVDRFIKQTKGTFILCNDINFEPSYRRALEPPASSNALDMWYLPPFLLTKTALASVFRMEPGIFPRGLPDSIARRCSIEPVLNIHLFYWDDRDGVKTMAIKNGFAWVKPANVGNKTTLPVRNKDWTLNGRAACSVQTPHDRYDILVAIDGYAKYKANLKWAGRGADYQRGDANLARSGLRLEDVTGWWFAAKGVPIKKISDEELRQLLGPKYAFLALSKASKHLTGFICGNFNVDFDRTDVAGEGLNKLMQCSTTVSRAMQNMLDDLSQSCATFLAMCRIFQQSDSTISNKLVKIMDGASTITHYTTLTRRGQSFKFPDGDPARWSIPAQSGALTTLIMAAITEGGPFEDFYGHNLRGLRIMQPIKVQDCRGLYVCHTEGRGRVVLAVLDLKQETGVDLSDPHAFRTYSVACNLALVHYVVIRCFRWRKLPSGPFRICDEVNRDISFSSGAGLADGTRGAFDRTFRLEDGSQHQVVFLSLMKLMEMAGVTTIQSNSSGKAKAQNKGKATIMSSKRSRGSEEVPFAPSAKRPKTSSSSSFSSSSSSSLSFTLKGLKRLGAGTRVKADLGGAELVVPPKRERDEWWNEQVSRYPADTRFQIIPASNVPSHRLLKP